MTATANGLFGAIRVSIKATIRATKIDAAGIGHTKINALALVALTPTKPPQNHPHTTKTPNQKKENKTYGRQRKHSSDRS